MLSFCILCMKLLKSYVSWSMNLSVTFFNCDIKEKFSFFALQFLSWKYPTPVNCKMRSGQGEKSALFGLILMEAARPFSLLRHFFYFVVLKRNKKRIRKIIRQGKKSICISLILIQFYLVVVCSKKRMEASTSSG